MQVHMRVRVRQNSRSRIAELSKWRAGLRSQEVNEVDGAADEAETARRRERELTKNACARWT